MSMMNSSPPKKPNRGKTASLKPKPHTEYTIFFRLERAYILQSSGIIDEEIMSSLNPNHQDALEFPRPAKYQTVALPPYWYSSAHNAAIEKKRKHRKRQDSKKLSQTISACWRNADPMVVEYCRKLARAELEKYNTIIEGIILKQNNKNKAAATTADGAESGNSIATTEEEAPQEQDVPLPAARGDEEQSFPIISLEAGEEHFYGLCADDHTTHTKAPQLMHQGNSIAIYRLDDTGFKVILKPNPSEEEVRKLIHEQNISQFLPSSCRKRQVTDVTSFNKQLALSFKWASGITLKEWLHKVHIGPQVHLNVRLRAAMAIAKTLSDFHDGGVVYNSIKPDNIILSLSEGEYVATLIDLSNAIIYKEDNSIDIDTASEKRMKEVDMTSLGLVLNQLFRGEETLNGEGTRQEPEITKGGPDHCRRRKRGKRKHSIADEGLPLYLTSLLSALINSSPDLFYESVKDVFLDLKIMAESTDGYFMKRKVDELTAKGRLSLQGDMFYGRQVQISMLLHLFQSSVVVGHKPRMATISGYPGTGKSTLVNQIKKPLTDLNGCFIEGKFNKSTRPDTVLASALNSFFGTLLETNSGNTSMSLKWRIHDAIGSSNNVLFEILPNLQKWMADGSATTECLAPSAIVKGIGSSCRLKFMLCNLIGAIACRAHPLILFLDDLQWADEITLDIIRMTMTDPGIHHFLFLGCYRDNEVKLSHPLTAKLNDIQEQGVSIVQIKLGPIEKECVNKLLSEVLCLPPSMCRSLSAVVHSKTCGIIKFILRFLASLNDEEDLWFSMSNRRWMYDLERIRRKEVHGDVVGYMIEHMKCLSKEMRIGLKVAACLGPSFDAKVLEKVKKDDEIGSTFFKSCTEFGFLQNAGSNSDKYIWSHEQIQQAAYSLIPRAKRASFHLLLGSRLFMESSPSEMEHMIFFIVDNMNRGSKLIDDIDQKWEVAQLNLEAGKKALTGSAFQSATKYLLAGLSHLGPDSWKVKYSLTLSLYDTASEALYITGNFSKLFELVDQPLMNARSFEDKLYIYNNLVRALSASSKAEEGISTCVDILSQLGEVIPTDITADVYAHEVAQVKQLMHGKSRQELFSLSKMSETNKLAAMQFLNHALSMTSMARPILNPVVVFRMVKMSIEHGISNISPLAFACYGAWLVNEPLWDVEGAHRMGRVANEMMKRLGATETTPRLYATVYGLINIWKEPWQAGLSKHWEAYNSGAKTGDMENALTNMYHYTNTALYGCGENLMSLSQNIQSCVKLAFQCKNRPKCILLLSSHQLSLDLMGIEQNAFLLLSDGMTEDSCYASCHDNNQLSMCQDICVKKKFVAFYTGDFDTAATMYDLYHTFPVGSTGRLVHIIVNAFVDGLIGLFFARKHREDESKWTFAGLDAIRSLKKWVKSSEWNFSNKLYLLEAEYYFLKEDDEKAIVCYHASIKAAREHRFIHEEGLAEEKIATYLLHKGRHNDALGHFINAKKCYDVWGAHALVHRVDKAIAMCGTC